MEVKPLKDFTHEELMAYAEDLEHRLAYTAGQYEDSLIGANNCILHLEGELAVCEQERDKAINEVLALATEVDRLQAKYGYLEGGGHDVAEFYENLEG